MKKILSVLLAVIMLFGAVGLTASAATPITDPQMASDLRDANTNGSDKTHVIIQYNLYDFTTKYAQYTYDVETGKFTYVSDITGSYYQVPQNATEFYVGYSFALPEVTAPEGKQFNGWRCITHKDRPTFAAGEALTITSEMLTLSTNNVIQFEVVWGSATPEEDTMGNILSILTKVFGAIIGILFYGGDTGAGVQLMENILGGLSL